jgi:hypothetical protein
MINEQLIRQDVEQSVCGLVWGKATLPASTWSDWENPRQVGIYGGPTETQT